jgi:hypothetical protein
MLVISCAAARCEVLCDLNPLQPTCHERQAASQSEAKPAMAGMHDCGMKTPTASPERPTVVSNHAQCGHQVCNQAPAVVQNDKGIKLSVAAVQALAIVAAFTLHSADRVSSQLLRDETPPGRSISPLEMSTILRV